MNYGHDKLRAQLVSKIAVCDRRLARLDKAISAAQAERSVVNDQRRAFVEASERLKQYDAPEPAATPLPPADEPIGSVILRYMESQR
jgi:hypothetical protein